jgi:hypothetical protein
MDKSNNQTNGGSITERGRLFGALVGAALGDALSATTPGCIPQFVHGDEESVEGFREAGAITSRVQLLLFAVAACMEGSIRSAARGLAAAPEELVLTGYKRWLHTQGMQWSKIDLDDYQRYHCWLIEEAVLYSERSGFRYGLGGEETIEMFFGPYPDLDEVLACSVGSQVIAPVALALVDRRDYVGDELFDATCQIADLFEEEEAQVAGLLAVILRELLAGRDLADVLTELNNEMHNEAVVIVDRVLGLYQEEKHERSDWATHTTKGALSLALSAALLFEDFESGLLEVISASGLGSDAAVFFGMLAGAMNGIESIDPQWVENLAAGHVITELASDVAEWAGMQRRELNESSTDWSENALWIKFEGTQFIPGASQLWEIDLTTPGSPELIAWNERGGFRRGLDDESGDRPLSADSVGVVQIPLDDGFVEDEGVRLFRSGDDNLYLYVSPFGAHPGLDYVTETMVTGRSRSIVGFSKCTDARSMLTFCIEEEFLRVFGGMSAFGKMGTFIGVEGGFDDAMQDDLGYLGLRADGKRGDASEYG